MDTNNTKRQLRGLVLLAGVLGVLIGALAASIMPSVRVSAQQSQPTIFSNHNTQGLTVELNFTKNNERTLKLDSCRAVELASKTVITCVEKPKNVDGPSAGVAITWNGMAGGSGCVIVGGKEFCW